MFVWPVRSANEAGIVADARRAARTAAEREYRRLLYVALTRAQDRLYVAGWETRQGSGRDTGCWYDHLAATAVDMAEFRNHRLRRRHDVPAIQNHQEAEPEKAANAKPRHRKPRRCPDWAAQPAPPESRPPDPLAPSRAEGEEQPALSPLQDVRQSRRSSAADWPIRFSSACPICRREARREAALRYLSRPAHGLDEAAVQALADEVMAVLDHRDFAPLFGHRQPRRGTGRGRDRRAGRSRARSTG